jgi:hypothetical protein
MKFLETDIKLMQLIQIRKLGKSSIRKYNVVFKEIYGLIGKTPSQLIAETKKEEQPYINEDDKNLENEIMEIKESLDVLSNTKEQLTS